MAKRKRGKAAVFTSEQNQALRTELKVIAARHASQAAVGSALGIEQQNVGRLLNDRRAGFGYPTATALVRLAGFASVDAFFLARGIASASSTTLVEDAQLHARAG